MVPYTPPQQKILFQLETNIGICAGINVALTNFVGDVSLTRTLVRFCHPFPLDCFLTFLCFLCSRYV